MASVLITGGTGMVGTHLCRKLTERGHTVSVLSRTKTNQPYRTFLWNIEDGTIEEGAVESVNHIIHLAGANLGDKRWTAKRKREIIDSRVKSAELILHRLRETNHSPKTFISASAAGYYGAKTSEKIFTEFDPPADDFLGTTCRLWEEAADRFKETGARVVKIRSGVVLSKDGGALKRMMLPVSLGIGSALGSGNQYLPWIHLEDLCNVFILRPGRFCEF